MLHCIIFGNTQLLVLQRCNHGDIFGATSAMVGQNLPPLGWNRVKVSENLGATAVAPVAPGLIEDVFVQAGDKYS